MVAMAIVQPQEGISATMIVKIIVMLTMIIVIIMMNSH